MQTTVEGCQSFLFTAIFVSCQQVLWETESDAFGNHTQKHFTPTLMYGLIPSQEGE